MSPTEKPAAAGSYHRPGYLRTLGAYENVKKSYEYCRGFVGVRTLAPVVEWVAEGTLSRVPIVKNLKEKDGETVDGYPMLHGLDNRLAELLKHFDDYVDVSVADPTSIQGRALRVVTHTVHAAAGYTPFVGGQIRRLMIEIDPDHMSRVPRLMDRPALDTTAEEGKVGYEQDGSEQEGRGSIDGETDDVSVMTDETSDETAERQGKKKTKAKRKDKRFLQNMGKGIKKVMNYPRTPVHELPPDIANNGKDSPSPSIGTEEAVAATPSPAISSSGGDSTTSSTSSGTPMRSTSSRKFFGSGSKKSVDSPAAASTSSSS